MDQGADERDHAASHLISEADLREQSRTLLNGIRNAIQRGRLDDITGSEWQAVRDALNEVSRGRAQTGFSPTETAVFVFSLKQPLFSRLRMEIREVEALADEMWTATLLLDKLGLYTTEVYQRWTPSSPSTC